LKDFEQIRELLNKSNYDKNTLKLGFSSFDNILSVKSSEILCFAGLPGSGKSMILGDIGVKAFWEGKKVLMYSLENSSLRVFQRYLSNILKINSNEITADADGVVEKLKNKISETEGDIILKEYMSNQVCSNDLMAHINDLILYKKWKPDIIIVDYILLMRTNDKQMSNDNSYKYYKTVTEELRNIAKTFKVPLLTACQINREGQAENGGSKALLTSKNISQSRGILDTVDYFITINQTVMEKKKNEMRLYLEKNRNEESGKLAKCKINYEHMTMWENAENS
jgi:replicative DNA helicase